jgi:hypothetical protein
MYVYIARCFTVQCLDISVRLYSNIDGDTVALAAHNFLNTTDARSPPDGLV